MGSTLAEATYSVRPKRKRPLRINSGSRLTLFDDLVGARQERRRDIDAKRPCGSQVDYEFEFGRLQNW